MWSPGQNRALAIRQSAGPGVVYQGAGPNVASIQAAVDQFKAALGGINNLNNPGPLATGRREINWDGGGSATSPGPSPFEVFLNSRGGLMTTPGTGFVQAPPSGLATIFGNPSLATTFQPFSLQRLFAAIGSTVTDVTFFIPGTNGGTNAVTAGFGAVYADVDSPDGGGPGVRQSKAQASGLVFYYDADGQLLYTSALPSSPGTASLSFFGIVFSDARIARVRIITGSATPNAGLDPGLDLIVMDDFIYGEPQIQQ